MNEMGVILAIGLAIVSGMLATTPAYSGQCQTRLVTSPGPADASIGGVAGTGPSDVWMAGSFLKKSLDIAALIEHWDGTAWSIVPNPKPHPGPVYIYELGAVAATSTSDAWTVGVWRLTNQSSNEPLTEHWNGSGWTIAANPANTDGVWLTSVTAVPGSVQRWAGGISPGFKTLYPTAWLWDGSKWTSMILPSPNRRFGGGLSALSAVSQNDAWAAGNSYDAFHNSHGFVDHWDGSTWSLVTIHLPELYSGFSAIDALNSHDVWLVGTQGAKSQSHFDHVLVEHWNGTSWQTVPAITPTNIDPGFHAVSVLDAGNVWATGSYHTPDRRYVSETLIEHWDGTSWRMVMPTPPGTLNGSAAFPYDVWSAGATDAGTTLAMLSHC